MDAEKNHIVPYLKSDFDGDSCETQGHLPEPEFKDKICIALHCKRCSRPMRSVDRRVFESIPLIL